MPVFRTFGQQNSSSPEVGSAGRGRPMSVERAVVLPEVSGYARYVGRVGALAVTLGVGAALVAMPVAFADTRGSGGSSGSAVGAADGPAVPALGGRSASPVSASEVSASEVSAPVSVSSAVSGLSAPATCNV